MKFIVNISNNAKKDLEEIIEYFFESRPDYAKSIFEKIFSKIQTFKDFPTKGRVVPELLEYNINEFRESIESYWRIIYRIENIIVEVFTIIDSRRNVQDLLVEKLKRNFA